METKVRESAWDQGGAPDLAPTTGAQVSDYVVEPAREALPSELQEFQRRMVGQDCRQADPARADWLRTRSNPYRREGEPDTWIARSGDAVVGVQAGIPFELAVGSEPCPATWAIDLMVDPEHRGHGLASSLVRAHQRSSRVEVAFGLSDGGFAIMMRTGAIPVGTASAYVHACDGRVLERKFGTEASGRPARLAGSVAAAGLGARCRLAARGTQLVPIESFDEHVDQIWREVASDYRVIVPRDSRWTRWRFDECPHRGEFERYYVFHRGRRIGYVVLRESTWKDLPTLEIVDYLARPRDVARLFASVAILARRRTKAAVECITLNAGVRHQLRLLGFVNRMDASRALRVTVRTQPGEPLRTPLCEPDAFFLTCADSDVDE